MTIEVKAMIVTSSGNISRSISFKNEEDDCSDDEEAESNIQHDTWMKEGTEQPHFLLLGNQALMSKFRIQ